MTNLDNSKNKNFISDKFIATFVLSAIADTISFNNGIWLFNYNPEIVTYEVTNELLYDFIDRGGINGIDITNWRVSSNTLVHMATAFGLLDDKLVDNPYIGLNDFLTVEYNNSIPRGINIRLKLKFGNLDRGISDYLEPYDYKSIDNICAFRTMCIGLAYNGEKNRNILIKKTLDNCILTNNSPVGYLGGLCSSLMTAFAIENIDINKWPFLILDILKSDIVKKYIRPEYARQEEADYDLFLMNWQKYIELKFENESPLKLKANRNVIYRSKFYKDHFTNSRTSTVIGASGYSSVIIAYDCLLDSGNNWEKIVIYSGLHFGYSTVTSSIAGALYGALYGWGDVPNNNFKHLEHKNILYDLGKNMYKKYFNNEIGITMTEKKPF